MRYPDEKIKKMMGIGKNNLTSRQILTNPVLFLAFGFGTGLARKAPGTFGTLAAIPVYLLLIQWNMFFYSIMTVSVILSGIWLCGAAAEILGEHDFSGIVWDEVAGFLVTMWFVPFTWQNMMAGFVLFRIFDIFKPWPIKWIDGHVQGGLGIMLDDVIAGIASGMVLYFIL